MCIRDREEWEMKKNKTLRIAAGVYILIVSGLSLADVFLTLRIREREPGHNQNIHYSRDAQSFVFLHFPFLLFPNYPADQSDPRTVILFCFSYRINRTSLTVKIERKRTAVFQTVPVSISRLIKISTIASIALPLLHL